MIIAISGKAGSGKSTVANIIQYLLWKQKVENNNLKYNYTLQNFSDSHIDNSVDDWKIVSFADKLKQIISILTGLSINDLNNQEIKNTKLGDNWVRYSYADGFYHHYKNGEKVATIMNNKECSLEMYEFEKSINWQTAYKREYTPRLLMQYIGTDLFRDQLLQNIWVNALFNDYKKIVKQFGTSIDSERKDPMMTTDYPNWIIDDLRFQNELDAIKKRGGITIRIVKNYLLNSSHISETDLDNITNWDYVIENNTNISDLFESINQILIDLKLIK